MNSEQIERAKYQDEINELLRMKKAYTGPQGCCVQTQEKNQWKAHCLSEAIHALSALRAQQNPEPCEYCKGEKYLHNGRKLGKYTDSMVGCDVSIDGKNLYITYVTESKDGGSSFGECEISLKLCPMCGHKFVHEPGDRS